MKFTIDRSVYANLLNKVKRNLLSSGEEETLKYIVHEINNEGLKLIASNFKSRAEFSLPLGDFIKIEEGGISCIYGPKLIDLVNAFSDGNICVEIEKKDNQEIAKINLESKIKKKNSYQIPCISFDIYPNNEFELENSFKKVTISPQIFKYAIKNTEYASSKDESGDVSLMNIYFEVAEDKIFASGVSFEMIAYSIMDKAHEEVSGNGTFFIMNYAVRDFTTLFDDVNEIEIRTDGKLLTLQQTSFIYYLRLLNVEFPNWKSKIDIEFEHNLVINKEELINTMKQIKIISPICKIQISNESMVINSVQIDGISNSISSAEEQLECTANGENTTLIVIDLLLDILNKASDNNVRMFFNNDPKSPIKVEVDSKTSVLLSTLKE